MQYMITPGRCRNVGRAEARIPWDSLGGLTEDYEVRCRRLSYGKVTYSCPLWHLVDSLPVP